MLLMLQHLHMHMLVGCSAHKLSLEEAQGCRMDASHNQPGAV